MTLALPLPRLIEGRFASIIAFTDEALFETTGVRIAFTTRQGGVSVGAYDSLNLGSHVQDDLACVLENRRRLVDALAFPECPLIVPNQVHGDTILEVNDLTCLDKAAILSDSAVLEGKANRVAVIQDAANEGCDALTVGTTDVAALLCFADCVPVIAVMPTGCFSVIHAGWRGVENGIAAKAVREMAHHEARNRSLNEEQRRELLENTNIYIGPHIHEECFETSAEIHDLFTKKYTAACSYDPTHLNLATALRVQLMREGIVDDRICDLDRCTVCDNDTFFSYRAQSGVAGRHGAFAVRLPLEGSCACGC